VLSIIGRALGFRLAPVRGVLVEPKGLAVAVHVRNVAPEDVPWVEAEVADIVGPREDLRILRGRKVLEVLPAGGWHKGRCALRIREHVAASAEGSIPMLYLGDDGTDEPAFWVLRSLAVTVRVGQRGPSHAAFRFDDVVDTHRLLSALAAGLGLPDTA
jgi:trehalose-phosphatase